MPLTEKIKLLPYTRLAIKEQASGSRLRRGSHKTLYRDLVMDGAKDKLKHFSITRIIIQIEKILQVNI